MNSNMTPEEFHNYWHSEENSDVFIEYLETDSEKEKTDILKRYGILGYKSQIDREIWLSIWFADRLELESGKALSFLTKPDEFQIELDGMLLQDYEKEYLLSAYNGWLMFSLADNFVRKNRNSAGL